MVRLMIPVHRDKRRESIPYGHIGHAPVFYVLDTEDEDNDYIIKNTSSVFGGDIPPIKQIVGIEADYVLTQDACDGALKNLNRHNFKVLRVDQEPLSVQLDRFNKNELEEYVNSEPYDCGTH